jgi:hypothetical protein
MEDAVIPPRQASLDLNLRKSIKDSPAPYTRSGKQYGILREEPGAFTGAEGSSRLQHELTSVLWWSPAERD